MNTVTLSIGPKSYTVACAEGQEAHIRALGAMIAEKYAQLGQARAPLEAQNLLFSALFLADELDQAKRQAAARPEHDPAETEALRAEVARLGKELAAVRKAAAAAEAAAARAAPPPPAPLPTPQFDLFGGAPASAEADADLAARLEALAARAEASAAALEAAVTSA